MKTRDILNEREKTHGDFQVNSRISQQLKEVMRSAPNWDKLPLDMKESLDMQNHKDGRILAGDYNEKDHWLDKAGYNTLVSDRL